MRRLVNAQMQLSPGATLAFARSVLAHVPLARSEHLQAGGVDHDMVWLLRWADLQPQFEARLTTAHRQVCRHREVNSHQPDHGLGEALRREQAEMEYRPHHECALDRGVGVDSGATATPRIASLAPGRHRLLVDPQGQAPTGDQRSVVLGPFADREPQDEIEPANSRNLTRAQVIAADQCSVSALYGTSPRAV